MERELQRLLDNKLEGFTFGIPSLDIKLGGIFPEMLYAIAASAKVGKTTFVDYSFLLAPYMVDVLKKGRKINWVYYSFEISRVRKMMKLAPFFFYVDYGKTEFTWKGKTYPINFTYLAGRMRDEDNNRIPVSDEDKRIFEEIYKNRLVPLFGEKDNRGNYVKKGLVEVIEQPINPTGIRNYLLNKFMQEGEFTKQKYETIDEVTHKRVIKEYITGYIPNDPEVTTIVIIDHIRKLREERGYTMKQRIDKLLSYAVEIRNWVKNVVFVFLIHLNRDIHNIEYLKFLGDKISPNESHTKDSGNIAEDSDVFITMFNPDKREYNLKTHYGIDYKKYLGYRSIHVVMSRDTEPFDVFTRMNPNLNIFTEIKTN